VAQRVVFIVTGTRPDPLHKNPGTLKA